MTVRKLEFEELPKLVALGTEFYAESNLPGKFVPEKFLESWKTYYGLGWGAVFGLVDGDRFTGALGGMTYPDPNDGETVATELFWFVNKESRGQGLKLFNEFERWAEVQGAKRISMIHLTNLAPDALRKLYLKRGYREVEVHFIKSI